MASIDHNELTVSFFHMIAASYLFCMYLGEMGDTEALRLPTVVDTLMLGVEMKHQLATQ